MKQMKFLVEKHADCYVAYPVGLSVAIVGQGNTCEEALADAKSAVVFHSDTFGREDIEDAASVLEAYIVDAEIPI